MIDERKELNRLSGAIIGAAIEVHKNFGPGLLESTYEESLCHELDLQGIKYEKQVTIPLIYKGKELVTTYRMDLLVEDKIVVEMKSVDSLLAVHEAQLLTYLKLRNLWLGLLINFNVTFLKNGIKRIVNGQHP